MLLLGVTKIVRVMINSAVGVRGRVLIKLAVDVKLGVTGFMRMNL